jgi:hypothetical protein
MPRSASTRPESAEADTPNDPKIPYAALAGLKLRSAERWEAKAAAARADAAEFQRRYEEQIGQAST